MEREISATLSQCGFSFKKKYGQNFITDKNLLSAIVSLAGVEKGDCVLEIGCGAGTLTRELAARADRVLAYEVDTQLSRVLETTLSGLDNVQVVFADFLKTDIGETEKNLPPYKVVANLPYYITSPLIMKFVEQSAKCLSMCVMVQEEVALRLCAQAGEAEYGAITAQIALRGGCRILKKVPRTVFYPRPNVDSALVQITFADGRIAVKDAAMYKKVVRAAFLSRRKTLENNLIAGFSLPRTDVKALLKSAGIPPEARGETISPEVFAVIADKLTQLICT